MAGQRKPQRVELAAETKDMAHTFDRVFSSPDGVKVLNHLRMIFRDVMIARGDSTHEIIARAAQHDVILQIESMMTIAENDKKSLDKKARGGAH